METVLPRFMRMPEVLRVCGIIKSTLYAKVVGGTFPSPLRVGRWAVAWREREIVERLDTRLKRRSRGADSGLVDGRIWGGSACV